MVGRLPGIEHDVTAIMDAAGARKKEIAREMEGKTSASDKRLEADTTTKLNGLRARVEIDMQTRSSKQKPDADRVLAMTEKNYRNDHEAYVRQFSKAVIER